MTFSKPLSLLATVGSAALLVACQPATQTADATKMACKASGVSADSVPHAQLPDTLCPTEYRIDMVMNPDDEGFTGTVAIDAVMNEVSSKIWLHGKEMTVDKATATLSDGSVVALTYNAVPLDEAPSGVAYLSSETELPKGKITLTLDYATPYNQALNSAYQVKRDGEGYIVTQFEPLGAREAFPSFDEPRFKVPFTLSITAPADDFVYANTPEVSATPAANGWVKHQFAKTRPLPTYLVAFGAGPYDVVEHTDLPPNSVRKRPLELRGITAKGAGEEIKYGLAGTEPILTALEEYFGSEYPYEKLDLIAAPDYAFGAMENPGAIVYREYLMLLNEGSPLSQKRAYNGVHSHELAHQWFGNLVTPVWWEDIWLNEAFATWMGNKGTSLAYPDGNYDRNTLNSALGAMNIDTLSTTRKVREPLARSENVMDQFDGITYRKGGGVLSMFESYVGEANFQKGVRLHMERYADDVATGDDFFQSIADGSGNPDVVDAMKSFVDQPGLPLIKGETSSDGGMTKVTFTQSRYAPLGSKTQQGQSWQIPVCARFGFGDTSVKKCELMTERSVTLSADGDADWVMPNENGSGYYRFSLDTEGWAKLIENLDQLNTREALTAQDSLVAAFRAGEVEADVFLEGMSAFAQHPEYDVASSSTDLIGFMYDEMPDSRDDLARLVRANYADRYERINGTDTVEGKLLAPSLASLLVRRGEDTALQNNMAERGARYLGIKGQPNKGIVPSNMIGLALSQTMKKYGERAYGPLMAMAESGNSLEKGAAVSALASTTDPAIYNRLMADVVLPTDSPLTGSQSGSLLFGFLRSDTFGEQTWDWFKENIEAYVTTKVPDVRRGGIPGVASGFCSTDKLDEVKSFMNANAALMPGYERSLAQTVESIELCAALKDAKASDLAAALKARK